MRSSVTFLSRVKEFWGTFQDRSLTLTSSCSESLPCCTRESSPMAVTALLIEPARNGVAGVTGTVPPFSVTPYPMAQLMWWSWITARLIPGTACSLINCSMPRPRSALSMRSRSGQTAGSAVVGCANAMTTLAVQKGTMPIMNRAISMVSVHGIRTGCASGSRLFLRVISDHPTVLHDEPDVLQLGEVPGRIAGDSDEIRNFPGLDRYDAVLPAEHFRRIDRDGANDIESRHPGTTQVDKDLDAGFATRLARIEPAHV